MPHDDERIRVIDVALDVFGLARQAIVNRYPTASVAHLLPLPP
jgi:hypothetical protein